MSTLEKFKRLIVSCIIILCASIQTYSQVEYKKHLVDVIKLGKTDTVFRYKNIDDKQDTIITEITYYGNTRNGTTIFYIKESYPAVNVRHGLMMLYLIDSDGKRYFYRDIDKPDSVEYGILSFKNFNTDGSNYYIKTDLNEKIPLFICQDNEDCYDYIIDDE